MVEKYHERLKVLKIDYEFRDEAQVSNGKVTAGRVCRVDDRNRILHDYDCIVEIGKDVWDTASEEFRIAIVDHELSHIQIFMDDDGKVKRDDKTDRIKIYMRHHDIEEFSEILERYGAYHADLRGFLAAFDRNKRAKAAGINVG